MRDREMRVVDQVRAVEGRESDGELRSVRAERSAEQPRRRKEHEGRAADRGKLDDSIHGSTRSRVS